MDTKELVEYFKKGAFAEAFDKRQQEFDVWTDYYQDNQINSYEKAQEIYTLYKEDTRRGTYSMDIGNLFEYFGKCGPYEVELADNTHYGEWRYLNRWLLGVPFTKKIIDTKGSSYNDNPEREFIFKTDGVNKNQVLKKYLKNTLIDSLLSKVDKFSILHGVAGVLVEFVQESPEIIITDIQGEKPGRLRFTPVLAHQIAVKLNNLGELEAVGIYYAVEDTIAGKTVNRFRILTKSKDITCQDGKVVQEVINELGVIPIAWLHNEAFPEDFFGIGVGRALTAANRQVNSYFAHANETILKQTQKITWLIDFLTDKTKYSLAPGTTNQMRSNDPESGGRIIETGAGAAIDQIWSGAMNLIRFMAVMFDIPPQILLDEGVTPSSKAIIQQSESMHKYFKERQSILSLFEIDFWTLVIKVLGTYGAGIFADGEVPEINIKFPQWMSAETDTIINAGNFEYATAAKTIGIPLSTPIHYLMDRYGLSQDKAKARWEETVQFYDEFRKNSQVPEQSQGGTQTV